MPPLLDRSPARPRAGATRLSRRAVWSGLDHGTIMGTELVVGILLYTFLGGLVDRWLGTEPWFLVIGAFVGFAAGLYLIWVRSARMGAAGHGAARGGDDDR